MGYVILEAVSGNSWSAIFDGAMSMTQQWGERESAVLGLPSLFVARGDNSKPELGLPTLGDGALVLREDIAREVLAGSGMKGRAIPVRRKDGQWVEGWVQVLIDDWVVLDRQRAQAVYHEAEDPLLALPDRINALAFRPEQAPRAPLARLVDSPRLIVADERTADALERATGKSVRRVSDEEVHTLIPTWTMQPAFDVSLAAAREAESAYARLRAGDKTARKAALTHPLFALAVALAEGEPRADTRTAASRHPHTAVFYATLLDRAPSDETRRGADAHFYSAHRYATTLDLAISDELAARLIATGWWDASNIAGEREDLAELRAHLEGKPQGPKAIATRTLPPAPTVDRIASGAERPSDEVCADIASMTARGLAHLGVDATIAPPAIIDALHRYVDRVREGTERLGRNASHVQLMLACVFAEQLHRAFGWQWAVVRWADGETVAVTSPTRDYAHVPLQLLGRVAKPRSDANTIALLFNMIAAGNLPPRGDVPLFID